MAKYANFKSMEIFLGKDIDLDVLNKNKETALVKKIKIKNNEKIFYFS